MYNIYPKHSHNLSSASFRILSFAVALFTVYVMKKPYNLTVLSRHAFPIEDTENVPVRDVQRQRFLMPIDANT